LIIKKKNEIKKFMENQNNSFKNNLPVIDNNIIKDNNIDNENINIRLNQVILKEKNLHLTSLLILNLV
jgi:uncharacterized lipoprotein YehR (DUF1307 family)